MRSAGSCPQLSASPQRRLSTGIASSQLAPGHADAVPDAGAWRGRTERRRRLCKPTSAEPADLVAEQAHRLLSRTTHRQDGDALAVETYHSLCDPQNAKTSRSSRFRTGWPGHHPSPRGAVTRAACGIESAPTTDAADRSLSVDSRRSNTRPS